MAQGGVRQPRWPTKASARNRGQTLKGLDGKENQKIVLYFENVPKTAKVADAFLEGMRALGYTEGRDFEMEYRWAEGYLERLPALAEESVRRGTPTFVAPSPLFFQRKGPRATSSKLPPIPPLFKADTAAFEPEVSWCPEQRKRVGSHSV
jgi:hypothetical protein